MKEIVITFDQKGGIKTDAIGFQGQGCKDATKVFLKLYSGGTKTGEETKPEAYMASTGVASKQSQRF